MDDSTRLELTKAKLLVLRRKNKSLLEIAAKNIVDNLNIYVEKEQLKNLPFCMREAVLRELLSRRIIFPKEKLCATEFGKKLNGFTTLLHPQTRDIDLDGLMSFCPSTCIEEVCTRVVQLIAARAPNVQSLSFGFMGSLYIDETRVAAICRLKELKNLDISKVILQYRYLTIICKRLKKLEQIQLRSVEKFPVDYLSKDNAVSDFKRCFKRLKVLKFRKHPTQPGPIVTLFRRICIKHLPKLQYVDFFESRKSDYTHESLLEIELPSETSSLRHLHTAPTPLPLGEAFPHLTHLTVQWFRGRLYHFNEIDSLLHFTKIEALILDDIPSAEIVDLFLNKYGKDLRELKIFSMDLELQFKKIFGCCPKLEKLTVQGALMTDDSESIQCFAKLREFDWLPMNGMSGNSTLTLSNILSAPLLESVVINLDMYHDVDLADLMKVSSLISNKSILSRAKTLNFHINLERMTNPHTEVILFRAVSEITKNACAFLPNCSSSRVNLKLLYNIIRSLELNGRYDVEPPFNAIHEASIYKSLGDANLAKFAYVCEMSQL
ncbi:uncharacterized protein LOC135944410 [Cloeon dipterum]|uniref:uncharacterized protein LOC135944410 n=1 Tax=Cloeon dipterum TaxID=197152 RepID=UPI00322050B8